jgi:hypothetical protein
MASSLDDMEAYELLQIELDRALNNFCKNLVLSKQEQAPLMHFLNHWIEYICFQRHMSTWTEIVATETEEAFMIWYADTFKEAPSPIETFATVLADFQLHFRKA